MRIDSFDFLNQALSRSNPMILADGTSFGIGICRWEGRVDQFRQKQTRLRNKIAEARRARCEITTPDADRWGSIVPPSRPRQIQQKETA
jgi:hypothetical protein